MQNEAAPPAVHDCSKPQDFQMWRAGIEWEMATTAGLKWCAVVDSASDPELPGQLWAMRERSEIWPLFMNTMLQEVSLKGPAFATLRPGGKIADWFLTRAETSAVGLLYAVPDGKEDLLFEHLQHLLETPLPGGGSGVFRFYDPRVLHALTCFHDSLWTRLVVGPATRLHAWDPGRSEALELHEGVLEPLSDCRTTPLPDDLLDFMARHNKPYAVLQAASSCESGAKLLDLEYADAFQFVESVCSSLSSLKFDGFRDAVDVVLFCLNAGRDILDDTHVAENIAFERDKKSLIVILEEYVAEKD